MSFFYEFDHVDTFTAGTLGRPGQRVFLLQARRSGRHVTVKCEKQQLAAIARYLEQVLEDLPPPEQRPLPGSLELAEPLSQEFVVGPIGLGYDPRQDRVVVQLEELVIRDDEVDAPADNLEELDSGQLRVYLSRSQAAAFCAHAVQVLAAGRPDCRWCSAPIDPDGHACPRMN